MAVLSGQGTIPDEYIRYKICNLRGLNHKQYGELPDAEVAEIWELMGVEADINKALSNGN